MHLRNKRVGTDVGGCVKARINADVVRAMRRCMLDGVPIGVLRQLAPKPNVRYSVLGLARIVGKAAGYYLLEGAAECVELFIKQTKAEFAYASEAESILRVSEIPDLRLRRLKSVVQRQGQPKFREQLLDVYEGRCAVTSCDLTDVLEAAHVVPFRGPHTNDVSNGIILRADIHILYDEGLLAIDPDSCTVRLAPVVRTNRNYGKYDGVLLHPGARRIDPELLVAHKHYCGFCS
jgi:putative restriction endonuclease